MRTFNWRHAVSGAGLFSLLSALTLGALNLTPVQATPVSALVKIGTASAALSHAALVAPLEPTKRLELSISLPLRNQEALTDLLHRLYDPADLLYGKYLKSDEFTARFGPTKADYDAVIAYVKSQGLTVKDTQANRQLMTISGSVAAIQSAFKVHMNSYKDATGRIYASADTAPSVPASLQGKILTISGLNAGAVPHSFAKMLRRDVTHAPAGINGTGPGGYIGPYDLRKAYDLNDGLTTGAGQTVALFEQGGFFPYDVEKYRQYFKLPQTPVTVMAVDGYDESPNGAYDEIALDIDMIFATAPGVNNILVYECPLGDGSIQAFAPGWLDELDQIASDDKATVVSMSYGLAEDTWLYYEGLDFITTEADAFQEMAAQGMSVFVSSGDNGAYADGGSLSVSDPASDPYVTAVGGTTLKLNTDQSYHGETVWNDFEIPNGATGGGISNIWSTPSWQAPFVTDANEGSPYARNVPDVAFIGDPQTGVDVYLSNTFGGPVGWYIFGGTSVSSPIWGGFTAKVDQLRSNLGTGPLGLATPSLYADYSATNGAGHPHFHDVADGRTNGNADIFGVDGFPAVTGYDLANGLGSPVGAYVLQDLSGASSYYLPPLNPLVVNVYPGDKYNYLYWTPSVGAYGYAIYRSEGDYQTAPYTFVATTPQLSYKDTGVTNGGTYNYIVGAYNQGGISDIEDEYANIENVPNQVQIIDPPLVELGPGYATIIWETNVLAASTVYYGTSPTMRGSIASNPAYVDNASVTLTGLTKGVTYYYKVFSYDGVLHATAPVSSFVAH